jgi:translation initiation factor 1
MSRLFSGTSFDRPPTCDRCGKPQPECRCLALPPKKKSAATLSTGLTLTPQNATPPKDQRATIRIEKRKGNREVTLITGLDHPANDLPALLTTLKAALGCGGSVQGRAIELQGQHSAKVAELLTQKQIKNRVA